MQAQEQIKKAPPNKAKAPDHQVYLETQVVHESDAGANDSYLLALKQSSHFRGPQYK